MLERRTSCSCFWAFTLSYSTNVVSRVIYSILNPTNFYWALILWQILGWETGLCVYQSTEYLLSYMWLKLAMVELYITIYDLVSIGECIQGPKGQHDVLPQETWSHIFCTSSSPVTLWLCTSCRMLRKLLKSLYDGFHMCKIKTMAPTS